MPLASVGSALNLNTNVAGKFDAAGAKALFDATAKQLEGRGWHVQFYTGLILSRRLRSI